MRVTYDGESYEFDLEEIDVAQASVIKRKTGMTLLKLEAGLQEADPDALRAVYWLMLAQSGKTVDMDHVNFKIVKFANAIQAAYEAEQGESKESGAEVPTSEADASQT